jgi:anthranilate phosphoribosyltransferase
MLERSGVALVHAGEAIPGWDRLAEIRDEVGVRGPVHSAEKLVGHFDARRFVVGYAHQPFGPRLLAALQVLGAERAVAVRGAEGSDVVRPGRPQAHVQPDVALELPERLGDRLPAAASDAASSAALTAAVLAGDDTGPAAHAVVLSAALRVHAAERSTRIDDAIAQAARAIESGAAGAALEALLG